MHDVQLADTTCTDQHEDEERDVVHHELRQPQSDASWTSKDETRNVILQACDQWMAEPCRQKNHCQQQESSFWHS